MLECPSTRVWCCAIRFFAAATISSTMKPNFFQQLRRVPLCTEARLLNPLHASESTALCWPSHHRPGAQVSRHHLSNPETQMGVRGLSEFYFGGERMTPLWALLTGIQASGTRCAARPLHDKWQNGARRQGYATPRPYAAPLTPLRRSAEPEFATGCSEPEATRFPRLTERREQMEVDKHHRRL
jgi:hypothetical protein